MTDAEILIPNFIEIKISGRLYRIGKLSVFQLLSVIKLLTRVFSGSSPQLAEYRKTLEAGTSTNADLSFLMSIIDESELIKLFGIILKEPDHDFVRDNISIEAAIDMLKVVLEMNDLEILKKKAAELKNIFDKATTTKVE
jgi:hypothetical protein